jgi:hypothetical protein
LKDVSLHGSASEVEFAMLESLKLLIMQQVEPYSSRVRSEVQVSGNMKRKGID